MQSCSYPVTGYGNPARTHPGSDVLFIALIFVVLQEQASGRNSGGPGAAPSEEKLMKPEPVQHSEGRIFLHVTNDQEYHMHKPSTCQNVATIAAKLELAGDHARVAELW